MQNFKVKIRWQAFGCLIALLVIAALPCAASEQCHIINSAYSTAQEQLWRDLTYLSSAQLQGRKAGTEGAQLAREFIVQRYQSIGLSPLSQNTQGNHTGQYSPWFHYFSSSRFSSKPNGANVVGYIAGQKVDEYIVISAHYDHLGKKGRQIYHGANDNASGVAALFYIAQELASIEPWHSIVFLATDYEEAGLLGAEAFLSDQVIPTEKIRLNINLDMIAQPGRDWTIYVAGTRWQPTFKHVIQQVQGQSTVCLQIGMDKTTWSYDRKFRINWRKASDHWAFAKRNIPWLYLGVKDYKYYHTPRDRVEKLSKPFYTGVVDTALSTVIAMDQFLSR